MKKSEPARPQPKSPRTKPSEVRRTELMDAAAALFVEKGLEATTVDDIVAAAGVSKGTFYHYFVSKHEILAALRNRYALGFNEEIASAVADCVDDDWQGKIRKWVEAFFDGYSETMALHDVVFHQHIPGNYRDERNGIVEQLQGILDAGMEAGYWRLGNSRVAALVMFQGVHSVVDNITVAGKAQRREIITELTRLFLGMLGSGRAAQRDDTPDRLDERPL